MLSCRTQKTLCKARMTRFMIHESPKSFPKRATSSLFDSHLALEMRRYSRVPDDMFLHGARAQLVVDRSSARPIIGLIGQ